MLKRLGLIVNPIAGMGGAVGLHGTDGSALAEARRRGAVAEVSVRANAALRPLAEIADLFELVAASGGMGEEQARAANIAPSKLYTVGPGRTTGVHTRRAAAAMMETGVELILFAGGDGTARDIHAIVGAEVPLLGIPAGVKMHSGVFATSPSAAGRLAATFVRGGAIAWREAEIMDAEGTAGGARLFGYARAPDAPLLLQRAKATTPLDEDAELEGACAEVARLAVDGRTSLIGPGTTMRRLKRMLGDEGTLIGVDAFAGGQIVGRDLSAADLLNLASAGPPRIIVGIVGGQGYLFGRGNQQFSPAVLNAVGRNDIHVVASMSKLLALGQRCLFVDTGDAATDRMLSGHIRIVTGRGRQAIWKVIVP